MTTATTRRKTTTTKPLRAALYLRQSLDRAMGTAEEGQAVERQREACLALAKARGWEVVAVFSDNDVSASTTKARPQFEKMLAAAGQGDIDVVIAWHADRLAARSPTLNG